MFGKLLSDAKSEGINTFEVSIFLHKPDGLLLLEKPPVNKTGFYEPPQVFLKEEESFNQAIDRAVMEKTNLKLEKVERFLGFFDYEENESMVRRFYFIGRVLDPEDIKLSEHHGYAWLKPEEAVGYPISDELREAFDLYIKT